MKEIEYDLADVIIGRPHGFTVGRKHFCLYPVTLAKVFLLKRQVDRLGINENQLKLNPYIEAIRLVKSSRDVCCQILAYHTAPNTKKDLFCTRSIAVRKNYFEKELSDEELASLVILVLSADGPDKFLDYLGLNEERERMLKVIKIKNEHDKGSVSFNGKSILGTFICQLKEMGYSDDEILYEKGYTYLRLMLADKIVTIHLTDEERHAVPLNFSGEYLDASDPQNAQKILAMMANRGVLADGQS